MRRIHYEIVVLQSVLFAAIFIFLSFYTNNSNGFGLLDFHTAEPLAPKPFFVANLGLFWYKCACHLRCLAGDADYALSNMDGKSLPSYFVYCNDLKDLCRCYRQNETHNTWGKLIDNLTPPGNAYLCKRCYSYMAPHEGWVTRWYNIHCNCTQNCKQVDMDEIKQYFVILRSPPTIKWQCTKGVGFCNCGVAEYNASVVGTCEKANNYGIICTGDYQEYW